MLVANPNDTAAEVSISFYTEQGPRNADPVTVPARSRLTMSASDTIWARSAGISVGSDQPVYAERAMYWADRSEGHTATLTSAPSRQWYLAEGCTDYGFETWITILNPGNAASAVDMRFLCEDGAGQAGTVVVPEVSLYGPGRRSGTCSMGAAAHANKWYLAEGATHSGFDTWLLLYNPGDVDTTAAVCAMTSGGEQEIDEVRVAARRRVTVKVDDYYDGSLSLRVAAAEPLCCERATYWSARSGGTCSTGYAR